MIWYGHSTPSDILYSQGIKDAQASARSSPSQEICGVIDKDLGFTQLANVAQDPAEHFELSSSDLQRHVFNGSAKAIVHSHLEGHVQGFSSDDVYESERSHIPYLLIHGENFGMLKYYDPQAAMSAPYEGRPWERYASNCFTLVRDWYKREQGFDFEGAIVEQLNIRGFDVRRVCQALDSFAMDTAIKLAYGALEPVTGWEEALRGNKKGVFQKGDLLLMNTTEDLPTHLGVLSDPENNKFIHQMIDRPSLAENFDARWRKCIVEVVRPPAHSPYFNRLSTPQLAHSN